MRATYKLVLFIFILVGCNTVQPPVITKTTETITVTEVQRDTVLVTEPDSASVKALFECDSLNQVVMTDLEIERGRKLEPIVQWKDKMLTVTMPVDSEMVYFLLKDRYETRVRIDTVFVPVREPPDRFKLGRFRMKFKHIIAVGILLLFAAVMIRISRK